MTRENTYTRRRMLRLTGAVGSVTLVAGCGGPEGEGEGEGEDGADVPAEEASGNGQEQNESIGAGDEEDNQDNESGADRISGDEAGNDTDE